jgi:hypothetical protein
MFLGSESVTLTILSPRDRVRTENLTEAHDLVDQFVQRVRAEPSVKEIWVEWPEFVASFFSL